MFCLETLTQLNAVASELASQGKDEKDAVMYLTDLRLSEKFNELLISSRDRLLR